MRIFVPLFFFLISNVSACWECTGLMLASRMYRLACRDYKGRGVTTLEGSIRLRGMRGRDAVWLASKLARCRVVRVGLQSAVALGETDCD